MLDIHQFRYAGDNLGYLVCGPKTALAIDGGAVDAMSSFLVEEKRSLKHVTTTHGHADHTVGLNQLASRTGAQILESYNLARREGTIEIDGEKIQVWHTPGHSADSVVFVLDGALITGDTLFNGTVGNCFTGDLEEFYRSIKRLLELPDTFLIYSGHDYVLESVAFAKTLEPNNPNLDRFKAAYNPKHVVSTLAEEKAVNPFLRFNEPAIIEVLKAKGLPTGSELERWRSVMSL